MKSYKILFVCLALLVTFAYSSSILGLTNKQPPSNQLHANRRSVSDNCSIIPTNCPVCKDDLVIGQGWIEQDFPTICDYSDIVTAVVVYPKGSKPLYKFNITTVVRSSGPNVASQYNVNTILNCILDCEQVWYPETDMILLMKPNARQDVCILFDERVLVVSYNVLAIKDVWKLLRKHNC